MPTIDPNFGKAVSDLLNAHGLGDRQAVPRTTLDHVTIGKMRKGIVPNLETVEKFARGFGEDVNYWRELAGYPPLIRPHLAPNTPFLNAARGGEIEAAIARRGDSVLQAVKRTGIDYSTLTSMIEGQLVEPADVERFAQAYDIDPDLVRGWFQYDAAWYYKSHPDQDKSTVDSAPTDTPSPYEALLAGISALSQEFGRPVLTSFDHSFLAELTHEGAEQQLAYLRGELEAGRI